MVATRFQCNEEDLDLMTVTHSDNDSDDDSDDSDDSDPQGRAGEVRQQVHPGPGLENQLCGADGLAHVPGRRWSGLILIPNNDFDI